MTDAPRVVRCPHGSTADVCTRCEVVELRTRLRAVEAERDEFQRKYHEAMEVLTRWSNVDSAKAVAEVQRLTAEVARLRAALTSFATIQFSDDDWCFSRGGPGACPPATSTVDPWRHVGNCARARAALTPPRP